MSSFESDISFNESNGGIGVAISTYSINQSNETDNTTFEIPKHQLASNILFNRLIGYTDVRRIYQRYDEDQKVIEYWIIFAEENRGTRKEIYGIEYDLIDYFEDYQLILHVVAEDDIIDVNLADSARLVHDKDT